LDIPKLRTKVTLALKASKKLAATAICALTCSAKVLNNLPLLRATDSFAHLRFQRLLDKRRHVLLRLRCAELLRAFHLEVVEVGVISSLCRTHLRRVVLSAIHVTWRTHAVLLEVRLTNLLRTKLTRCILRISKRALRRHIHEVSALAELTRRLHVRNLVLKVPLLASKPFYAVAVVDRHLRVKQPLRTLHQGIVIRQLRRPNIGRRLRYLLNLRLSHRLSLPR